MMKVTIKQIAEETGYSVSTVSRVVTGKGYVSDEARTVIQEAISQLNYVKKEAQNIPLNNADSLVMILIGGIKSSLASENVELLTQELTKKGKRPFIAVTSFSAEQERSYLKYAADNHFFGVISLTVQENPETLMLLRNYPIPMIVMDRYLPSLELDYLRPDYYKMGFVGAEYLIQHGHKRIAFIGGSTTSVITQDKITGFEDCMRAYGLEVLPEWIFHSDRLIYENGSSITDQLISLTPRPTAIVSSNDISVSILNELLSRGIHVPEDMSIFTCEDSNMAAHCLVPLTAMKIDFQRMSSDAVKALFRRHRQPRTPRYFLTYSPQLIERKSVADLSDHP